MTKNAFCILMEESGCVKSIGVGRRLGTVCIDTPLGAWHMPVSLHMYQLKGSKEFRAHTTFADLVLLESWS